LTPAVDLYKGAHRQNIRACASALSAFDSQLWIISAGFGLIPKDAAIPPYSATFSRRDLDSVGESIEMARDWWELLSQRNSLLGLPKSVTELHRRNPTAVFLFCLSSPYVEVLLPELEVLATLAPGRIAVFSAGSDQMSQRDTLMPLNARFERHVGGSRGSLNSRILLDVIRKLPADQLNPIGMRKYLEAIAEKLPPLQKFVRRPLMDRQIQEKIAIHLSHHRDASASSTLRAFRDQGFACERSRFHHLFKSITNSDEHNQNSTAR